MCADLTGDPRFLYPRTPAYWAQLPYYAVHKSKSWLERRRHGPRSLPPVGLTVGSRAHDTVFFGIPKVGTRSFMHAISALPLERRKGLVMTESTLAEELIRGAYFAPEVVTLVRNPWARTLSCYRDKIARLDSEGHRARRIARFPGLAPAMSFANFVEWLSTPAGADSVADRHWRSQSSFLNTGAGTIQAHQIESFGGQIEIFDTCLDLGRENATGGDRDYRQAYTPELREKVAERYAEDIERFGYTF